jgi:hypothetical protein
LPPRIPSKKGGREGRKRREFQEYLARLVVNSDLGVEFKQTKKGEKMRPPPAEGKRVKKSGRRLPSITRKLPPKPAQNAKAGDRPKRNARYESAAPATAKRHPFMKKRHKAAEELRQKKKIERAAKKVSYIYKASSRTFGWKLLKVYC